MALFGSKKKEGAKKVTPKAVTSAVQKAADAAKKAPKVPASKKKTKSTGGLGDVMKTIEQGSKTAVKLPVVMGLRDTLKKPRITEKAAGMTVQNVYTFDIARGASKHDVVRAIVALYKVTPIKVNVVNVKGKKKPLRTRRGFGTRNAVRKAYVFLKAGDKIDFAA